MIENTSQLLLNQVKGNLDRNLLDQELFSPQLEAFPLFKLVAQTRDMLKSTAILQGISLLIEYNDLEDRILLLDKMRIQQILINLLQNAIKFSKDGDKIIINVNYITSLSAATVRICVDDQGIGISAEDQKQLFQPYFKTKDE